MIDRTTLLFALMNSLNVSRTANHQRRTNATQRCSPSCAELCCRDRMPSARSETRSNTRANAVTPGRSSVRKSEPPAKPPVSATVISKTHRPNGFGSVRDQSEATHSFAADGTLDRADVGLSIANSVQDRQCNRIRSNARLRAHSRTRRLAEDSQRDIPSGPPSARLGGSTSSNLGCNGAQQQGIPRDGGGVCAALES